MHPACLHHGEGAIVYVSVRLRVSLRSSHARLHPQTHSGHSQTSKRTDAVQMHGNAIV